MLKLKSILAIAVMLLASDVFAEDVFVAGGDIAALQAAIDAANTPGSQVTIRLEAGQIFEGNPRLETFTGNMKIEGNGAVFNGGGALGEITSDGAVTITGVTFTSANAKNSFIDNWGSLSLDRVTFSNISVDSNALVRIAAQLLLNRGSAELVNVTIDGTKIRFTNNGSVIWTLVDATTSIAHLTVLDTILVIAPYSAILRAASEGSVSVSNSIILADGNTEETLFPCRGPIIDNGGNFASSVDCGFSGGVIDRASLGTSVEKGHDAWVVPLIASSVATDAGNPAFCEKLDGRGFERDAQCDSGAFEAMASNRGGELGRGGVSGIYYTPETDGNYVQLLRVFDGNVVVIWNTFDTSGAQAWVYGVGSYQDGVVTADAFRNLDGVLQPGAGASTATVTDWGTIKVTVHNCHNVTVDYESSDLDFGSGTFEAQRLAFVHDLGCSER